MAKEKSKKSPNVKTLYLYTWINFGKYKNCPNNLKNILDTPEGREWALWIDGNSYYFQLADTSKKYIKLQEEHDRYVLPTT